MFLWLSNMSKNICHVTVGIKVDKLSEDGKKERDEIAKAICALLNTTGGGQLDICMDRSFLTVASLIRPIEQRFKKTIGGLATSEMIFQQSVTPQKITFLVTAMDYSLCTLNYYLFLPSAVGATNVQTIKPNEPITAIERIVEGKQEPCYRVQTQLGTHRREFTKGEQCWNDLLPLPSNVVCKPLKGRNVKGEITSKQGKFQSQVSAFANDIGGHIYHGIKSGQAVGVRVKENGNEIIVSGVEEELGKLIWGGDEKPKRGKEWDIFFEPVKDENDEIIRQTFVIVVSIASFKGGVFIAEPECYHVVRGEVDKMSFGTWKKELLRRRDVRQCKNIDEHVNTLMS